MRPQLRPQSRRGYGALVAAVLLTAPWTVPWAVRTWYDAATPQGQITQACRSAGMAVIEVGADRTPTRCYRTMADWRAHRPSIIGG